MTQWVRGMAGKAWWLGMACMAGAAWAQGMAAPGGSTAPAATAQQAAVPGATAGARFLEACNQSLQKGVADLGCQGPIYRNELERLKQEALSTQNPQLLSFVGEAYENQRSGIADVSQAYRWYLLAAVRGDPRAMQRLAEMNRKGQGVPQDKVKALGYARLAERLGSPGMVEAGNVAGVINELGAEMAAEEMALAERFSSELEAHVRRQGEGGATAAPTPAAPPAFRPGGGLPGVPRPMITPPASHAAPALPGTRLPGVPERP